MKRGLIRLAALLLVSSHSIVTLSQSAEKQEQPKRIAIKAGRLLDTKTGAIANNAFILIEGDKIAAVGPEVSGPGGTGVIDLKAQTVPAGPVCCHTHMTSQPGNYYEDIFRKSPI